jgi:hypothetical protein
MLQQGCIHQGSCGFTSSRSGPLVFASKNSRASAENTLPGGLSPNMLPSCGSAKAIPSLGSFPVTPMSQPSDLYCSSHTLNPSLVVARASQKMWFAGFRYPWTTCPPYVPDPTKHRLCRADPENRRAGTISKRHRGG